MRKIKMNLTNAETPIFIGENIFGDFPSLFKKAKLHGRVFFLVDTKVYSKHKALIDEVRNAFENHKLMKINATEEAKSLDGLSGIYKRLIANKFGRDAVLVAIGGGIIGDLGGFAAATFSRGIKYVQVPTTLLAMTDSAIGGKTGINFGGVKNIVGAFYQPEFILSDIAFLKTLPREDILSGLGEVIKYGVLTDEKFFDYVVKNLPKILNKESPVLQKIVYESAKIKAAVVENDERESGLRKILNLGHTFAHAYESVTLHELSHGKAVILGIASALILAKVMNLVSSGLYEKYFEFFETVKTEIKTFDFKPSQIYSIMRNDKKNRDGKIKFVLPVNFGEIALDVEAPKNQVFAAIKSLKGLR